MIALTQRELVRLLVEKIKSNGTSTTGTYNKLHDATHFEKGHADFASDDCDPEAVLIEASFYDNTWGIDFKFTIHSNASGGYGVAEECSAYFDNDAQVWAAVDGDFFKIIKSVMMAKPWKLFLEEEGEDRTDPAGGYGLNSHE